tara:strand:+ start:1361 stop:2038 length:678 start_codon:yes stop_codon:yes gene_type:complete
MGTLASNRKGFIVGASASSYGPALEISTGTANDSHSSSATALQYFRSSGRGGGTFRFIRTFLHFDTSGISGGSDFKLNFTSGGANGGNLSAVTALKHTAGNNGGELANGDFDLVDPSTPYSSSTAFGTSGTVVIDLNAAAATAITTTSHLNIAILLTIDLPGQLEEDPLENDGDVSNTINFGNAINLVYTDAASGYSNSVAGLASGSISKVIEVATANIDKVIGS